MAVETVAQSNATTFTPLDIVTKVLAGGVRVPSFQRGLRWQWEDVRRLFDSIVKGYPIGSFLLWERKAEKGQVRLGALDIKAPSGTSLFVVDGQQRITSLANALTEEGSKDPRFALAFDLKSNGFMKPSEGSESHIVPLHVIFDLKKVLAWFAKRPDIVDLLPRASEVTEMLRQYAIPAYVVKQQDEDVLRNIFDRMNNYGRRLTRAEVFSALHGVQGSDGSSIKISDLAEAVDAETNFGLLDDDTVLRAVLARRGGDVTRDIRSEFKDDNVDRDFGNEDRSAAYRKGQAALALAIRFLQQNAGVPHFAFLPYRYLLVVLTRFFAHFPSPSPRNRTLLQRFFWRAALAGPMPFRGAWTNAMRALATKIAVNDESGSVQRLLDPFVEHKFAPPRLDHFRTNTAETRIILCALWSLEPMSPSDGVQYGLEDLVRALGSEITPRNALRLFYPRDPRAQRTWTGNWAILLDDVESDARSAFIDSIDEVGQFNNATRSAILKSHGLNKSMIKLLQGDDPEGFLRERQKRLQEIVRDFIARMAETQFEDTPPLDDLNLDNDDARDDALA